MYVRDLLVLWSSVSVLIWLVHILGFPSPVQSHTRAHQPEIYLSFLFTLHALGAKELQQKNLNNSFTV